MIIKCPNCGDNITLNENQEAAVMAMVRDSAFESSVERRAQEITDLKLSGMKKDYAEQLLRKENEISSLKKDNELSIISATSSLQGQIERMKAEGELAIAKVSSDFEKQLSFKDAEIERLKAISETEKQLAVSNAKLESDKREADLISLLKEQERQTEYYKDLKAKMSTKMVGETLEQHCLTEFNKLRATAFKGVYFEKDNDVRTGSKGDFIYRECDSNGVEIISIMFEMKNELDSTEHKHKNESFFKELDKDRREKGCEYAVLVSMLEADSELYNTGIVDVSYEYEKMYVIRPQFFIPMITILRNAAYNALSYRQELEQLRNQETDVQAFENVLADFKERFSKNYSCAESHLASAIDDLDKTINKLQKVRDDLLTTQRQLHHADTKLDSLSVKKLKQ